MVVIQQIGDEVKDGDESWRRLRNNGKSRRRLRNGGKSRRWMRNDGRSMARLWSWPLTTLNFILEEDHTRQCQEEEHGGRDEGGGC